MNFSLFQIRARLVGISFSLLTLGLGHAQESGGSAGAGAPGMVSATPFGEWEGPPVFVQIGRNDFAQLNLSPGAYSPSVEVRFPLMLVRENPAFNAAQSATSEPSAAPPPPYIPVCAPVTLPEGVRRPLLVLRWNKEQGAAECRVIENDPTVVPWGAYQVINFSQRTVGLSLAERNPAVVAPGGSAIVNPELTEPTFAPIELLAELEQKDGSKKLVPSRLSTAETLVPDRRTILLVADDPNHRSKIAYITLIDFKPPPEGEMQERPGTTEASTEVDPGLSQDRLRAGG